MCPGLLILEEVMRQVTGFQKSLHYNHKSNMMLRGGQCSLLLPPYFSIGFIFLSSLLKNILTCLLFWLNGVLAAAPGVFTAAHELHTCVRRTLGCPTHVGSSFPNQGSNLGALHWEPTVLPNTPSKKTFTLIFKHFLKNRIIYTQ